MTEEVHVTHGQRNMDPRTSGVRKFPQPKVSQKISLIASSSLWLSRPLSGFHLSIQRSYSCRTVELYNRMWQSLDSSRARPRYPDQLADGAFNGTLVCSGLQEAVAMVVSGTR